AGWEIRKFTYENPWTHETIERDRVFIPSKLQDNRFLGQEYVANLQMVGSDTLVRAWLEGDWTVIEGAYFDCWRYEQHVVEPFAVPSSWARFRSMDWGSAKPFSVGWWAIVGDDRGHSCRCPWHARGACQTWDMSHTALPRWVTGSFTDGGGRLRRPRDSRP